MQKVYLVVVKSLLKKVYAYPLTASKFYSIRTKFLILKRAREESYSPLYAKQYQKIHGTYSYRMILNEIKGS